MILNNYWAWREACENASVVSNQVPTNMTSTEGNTNINMSCFLNNSQFTEASATNFGFKRNSLYLISSSEASITPNDYMLSNILAATNATYNITCNLVDGKLVYTANIAGSNQTGSEYAIRKVGIAKKIYVPNTYQDVLMAVVELSEPITVPNGSGFSITVEIIEE